MDTLRFVSLHVQLSSQPSGGVAQERATWSWCWTDASATSASFRPLISTAPGPARRISCFPPRRCGLHAAPSQAERCLLHSLWNIISIFSIWLDLYVSHMQLHTWKQKCELCTQKVIDLCHVSFLWLHDATCGHPPPQLEAIWQIRRTLTSLYVVDAMQYLLGQGLLPRKGGCVQFYNVFRVLFFLRCGVSSWKIHPTVFVSCNAFFIHVVVQIWGVVEFFPVSQGRVVLFN